MGSDSGRRRNGLLGLVFFLSGAAALMDQVVWLRYLSLTFGNTTHATATLLAIFLGGLGLGAFLFGRWADRLARPLTIYALVEVGIALMALASPALFDGLAAAYVALYRGLGNQPLLFAAGRVLLAAVILLPPTVLMGGTLPLILRSAVRRQEAVGQGTALFYAANTLGAMAGVALAGFVSIRLIGLYGTLLVAATLNLAVALGCLALSRPVASMPPAPRPREPVRSWLLLLFFLMGGTSLAYEVLWTRILVFYLGSSVYAYSLMLLIFLLGLGVGSLLATPWADRVRSPLLALAWVEAGIGAWALFQIQLFQGLNESLRTLAAWLEPQAFGGVVFLQLVALLPLLGPPTFLMGLSFPLAVRALNRHLGELGTDVGATYAANTLGSVVGSLATGFVLIPVLGTQDSLLAVASVNALLGAAAWMLERRRRRAAPGWRWVAVTLPLVLLAARPLFPQNRVILAAGMFRPERPQELVHFREDASATVTIRRLPSAAGSFLSLELNGVNVAGTSPDLYAIQKMQGHLPMALTESPREVLHIGFGSGGTAHAVSLHPVERIQVAEISPAVIQAARRYFPSIHQGVLDDPRLKVEINDGRNYLLAIPRSFDLILSDSIHPRYAGNGALYTLEYFQLMRNRLRPGGTVSMWLPMYSLTPENYGMILRAFQEVFPETTVWYVPTVLNSFTIVTGREEPGGWRASALERTFADPRLAAELQEIGMLGPGEILGCYLAGGEELAGWTARFPPHVDDLPAVEYESGALLARDWTWLAIFTELLSLRPQAPPPAYLEALPPAERERAKEVFARYGRLFQAHRQALARGLAPQAKGEVPVEAPVVVP